VSRADKILIILFLTVSGCWLIVSGMWTILERTGVL